MSAGLALEPRALAPAESLAGRLLAGSAPVALPRPGGASPAPRPRAARLEADAFGVSSDAARVRLERVLDGEGFAVTTGQQPVLFLGPLYVLYKALTAIELAARLEEALEVPVVPVFWIAGDDHDWDEIGRTRILDPANELRTLSIGPPPGYEGRPAGPVPLGPQIEERIGELSQLLPASEFAGIYLDLVRDAYRPDATVSSAFARTLGGVLEGLDYAWLEAAGAPVKAASRPFFERMLDAPDAILGALAEGAAALERAGVDPPVPVLPRALPLFHDDGGGRERVYARDGGFAAGRETPAEPTAVWKTRLETEPGRFSPNVSSRPALESWLLPVAATVLGPGELAYWSELPPLFEALDVPLPAIQPRAAWTVVEPRNREFLDRFGLEPDDLEDGGRAAIDELAGEARPETVADGLSSLRRSIGEGLSAAETAIRDVLPGLRASVGKARKAMFDAAGELESQVDAEVRRQQETRIDRIRRLAIHLYPDGRPQERVLSPFYHLSRYGEELTDVARARTREWLSGALAAPRGEG